LESSEQLLNSSIWTNIDSCRTLKLNTENPRVGGSIPTLQLSDVKGEFYTGVLSYVRVFGLFGKSARVDVLAPYSTARWDGKLEGKPASARRRGFNDPKVRFAVNLVGSPAQSGAAFRRFKTNTIVGAAVKVTVPVGENKKDKLLNLGGNRWVVKPQVGIVHNWGKWAAEITGSAWFYEDNDNFFGGKKLEQDPLYSVQSHLIYTFRPGLWASLSGAYGAGGGTTVDGVSSRDRLDKTIWAVSVGLPVTSKQGIKFAYLRGDTHTNTGDDFNRYLFAYSVMWGGD
jgi:hypothetical protein